MFIPMIIKDNVKGVISIQSYKSAAYNIEDLITFKILSSYITIALENSILYRKVEYNANYDGLTSIYNRRRAIEKINKLREKLNNNEEFYVAMIDIDNFKEVNDIYGHNMGDKVLIEVAKVLKDSIKKDDILGRYGGEELILLMKNNNGEIIKDIERIRENIEKLTIKDINNNVMNVTVSIGVEVFDKKYNTLEANISLADKKLYEAKNTGKNKVVF